VWNTSGGNTCTTVRSLDGLFYNHVRVSHT